MAHIRQSRPDSGLGFQVYFFETLNALNTSQVDHLIAGEFALERVVERDCREPGVSVSGLTT